MAPAAHDKTEQASKKSAVEPTSDVDDDDEDEDDVSARAIFPLIFARLPIYEPIPASPRPLNPARFVRASRGAANSALLAAFIFSSRHSSLSSAPFVTLSSCEPRETARLSALRDRLARSPALPPSTHRDSPRCRKRRRRAPRYTEAFANDRGGGTRPARDLHPLNPPPSAPVSSVAGKK